LKTPIIVGILSALNLSCIFSVLYWIDKPLADEIFVVYGLLGAVSALINSVVGLSIFNDFSGGVDEISRGVPRGLAA